MNNRESRKVISKMQLRSKVRKLKRDLRKKDVSILSMKKKFELLKLNDQERDEKFLILREKILLKMQTIAEDDRKLSEMFGLKQKHKHELMKLVNSKGLNKTLN